MKSLNFDGNLAIIELPRNLIEAFTAQLLSLAGDVIVSLEDPNAVCGSGAIGCFTLSYWGGSFVIMSGSSSGL